MGVALQIRKQADYIAKGIQNSLANYGTGLWPLVDAAGDQPYENRVKSQTITDVDTALSSGAVWSTPALKAWFDLHKAYFSSDLGLTDPVFDAYLALQGFRFPYLTSEAMVQALGPSNRLLPRNVFPNGTLVATGSNPASSGMHKIATILGTASAPTFTLVDGALDTNKVLAAPILITNNDDSPAPSSLTLRYTRQDATTIDIVVSLAATTQYAQTVVGKQAITGVSGAVFSCAATSQFKVGEWVLLSENADGDTSIREVAQIKTIVANTSIEFVSAPANTFTTAGFIIPQFSNVAFVSGTLGSGMTLSLWAMPDRIITL